MTRRHAVTRRHGPVTAPRLTAPRLTAPRLAALGLAVAVAGCGVTAEDTPRGIDPPRVPFGAVTSTRPAPTSGTLTQTLFLVRAGKLVAVTRHVNSTLTLDGVLAALRAGPTDSERDQGITSALLGSNIIRTIRSTHGEAVVELAAPLDGAHRTDDVLAYAQLVCTLTSRPEISGVTFTREDKTIGVPRADGSLSQGPLTATDYAPLLA